MWSSHRCLQFLPRQPEPPSPSIPPHTALLCRSAPVELALLGCNAPPPFPHPRTLWPAKRNALSCGLKFHTMTQLSSDPEMSCFMLWLKHTDVTASLWPRNDRSRVGSSCCGCRTQDVARGMQACATRQDGLWGVRTASGGSGRRRGEQQRPHEHTAGRTGGRPHGQEQGALGSPPLLPGTSGL